MKREKSKPELTAEAGLGTKQEADKILNDEKLPESKHVGAKELDKYDEKTGDHMHHEVDQGE